MTGMMLYGDTEHSAAMRHEVPIAILDPFLLVMESDRTWIMSWGLEANRLAGCRPDAELLDVDDLGFSELLKSGIGRDELDLELTSRAAAQTGVKEAIVDFDFPIAVADRLRGDGISLRVDPTAVSARRRRKSGHELRGIRRAQDAAHAAMATAASILARSEPDGDSLRLDGDPLTAEMIRAEMRETAWKHGTLLPPDVIVASVWQGVGHEAGFGPLPARLPIEIDIWPCDTESGCWADMTRTFVVGGEPADEVRHHERLARRALDDATAAVRPGVTGRELHELCCDLFEGEGYRTQRTGPGEDPNEGFQFSLGHGVGLRVHEAPNLGQSGTAALVTGDVLAVEPGLWNPELGGVRFEDLLLVTDDGCERLTQFTYSLDPSDGAS
jgi:Xaa-Pro aminopeptidase